MRRRNWEISGTAVGLAALVSVPNTTLKTLVVWGLIVIGVPAATVGFVVAVVNARTNAIVEFNSRRVQDDFQRNRSSAVTASSVELKLDDSIRSRQLLVQRFLDSNDPAERTRIRASAMRILGEDSQTIAYAREASSPRGTAGYERTQAMIGELNHLDNVMERISLESDPAIKASDISR